MRPVASNRSIWATAALTLPIYQTFDKMFQLWFHQLCFPNHTTRPPDKPWPQYVYFPLSYLPLPATPHQTPHQTASPAGFPTDASQWPLVQSLAGALAANLREGRSRADATASEAHEFAYTCIHNQWCDHVIMLYLKNVRVMNQKLRIRKVGCTLHMSTLYMYIQYHPKHFYTHCNVAGMSCILPPIPGDGPSGPNFFPTQVCLAVGFLGMLRPRPRNGFPDAWDFYTLFSQKHIDGILVVSRYPIMAICMLTRPYIYI